METRSPANLEPYQKWETMIDTSSFLGAGALTCALQGVSLIEPTGLGILLTSGASALGIAGLNKFLSKDLPFLKICAAVAALALTTFSLPFVFATLGTHAFILLSTQTAVQVFAVNLITKAASFALFQASLFFKNYNNFRLPKNAEEIDKLKSSELLQVKNHLLQFPAKTKELSLPYQVSLNKNLKTIGQEQLPIFSYSTVGEEWTKEDVKHLHKEDLSHLTLNQRVEVAELFINYELSPQKRPYTKDEFPKFDSVLEKKKFSQAAADWVNLLLQLDPKAKISPKILKELKIEPPAKPKKILPIEKAREADYSIFDWRLGLAGTVLVLAKTTHYLVNNYFTAPKLALPSTALIDLGRTTYENFTIPDLSVKQIVKVPSTALIDLGRTVYEKFTIPDLSLKQIVNVPSTALIDLGRTIYEKFTIPNWPRIENLIPQIASPINEAVSQNFGTPILTQIPPPSSWSSFYTAGLLGLGALSVFAIYRNWGSGESRNQNILQKPLPVIPSGPAKQISPRPSSSNSVKHKEPPPPQNSPTAKRVSDKVGDLAIIPPPPPISKANKDPNLAGDLAIESPPPPPPNSPTTKRVSDQAGDLIIESPPPPSSSNVLEDAPVSNPLENGDPAMEILELVDEPKKLDWDAFKQYVSDHCTGIEIEAACKYAKRGLRLIRKIKSGGLINVTPTENDIVAFCWGAMLHMVSKNQAFVEGTIDIEDQDYRIFNYLFSTPSCYGRYSSHYESRAIAIEEGKWKGWKHFGIDLDTLPAGMRTVMFGKILSTDKFTHSYLKMETHGANLNIFSDPNARRNILQPIVHTGGLVVSQLKRRIPSVFGDVGGGEHDRKEHLPEEDKRIILELIKQIQEQDQSIEPPTNHKIKEWGFAVAREFFKEILSLDTIQAELRTKIQLYIEDINRRYPNLSQKGNEGSMGMSVFSYEDLEKAESLDNSFVVMEEDGKTAASDKEEDDFEVVNEDGAPQPSDRDTARENFLSKDLLKAGTVNAYANFLHERQPQFNFVNQLIYSDSIASAPNKEALIGEKFELALQGNDQLVFIPFILEKQTRFTPDHIVLLVLNPKERTYEYYNSQGGDLKDEKRTVLGVDLPANAFLNKYILENPGFEGWTPKFNQQAHQGFFDLTNCGAFVCWFMKYRLAMSFEELCAQNVQIEKERVILSEDL